MDYRMMAVLDEARESYIEALARRDAAWAALQQARVHVDELITELREAIVEDAPTLIGRPGKRSGR